MESSPKLVEVPFPTNAETSMSRLDLGKWKFVIMASTMRKLWPGNMKIEASDSMAENSDLFDLSRSWAACSSTRTDVVPTAMMRRHPVLAWFKDSAASGEI